MIIFPRFEHRLRDGIHHVQLVAKEITTAAMFVRKKRKRQLPAMNKVQTAVVQKLTDKYIRFKLQINKLKTYLNGSRDQPTCIITWQ